MGKKFYHLVFTFFLIAILAACSSNSQKETKSPEPTSPVETPAPKTDFSALAGKITDNITCDAQPLLSYCLYLPSSYSSQKNFPVIFIFDAHADGKLPVEKYSALAEESGFVLAASNNSKNGIPYDSLVDMAKVMMRDVASKISIDASRKYVMGFSGGARVAGVVASSEKDIAGVIGSGAAYMDESAKSRQEKFFFGFAGKDDFNLLEMYRMHEYFEKAGIKNYLQVFEGKHEWPDSLAMQNAFHMLTANAEQKQTLEKKIAKNTVTPAMAKTFEAEAAEQKKYIDAFTSQNIFWWKSEISNLQQCGKTGSDKEKMHRCRRLLAYIGVAVYSFSGNAIKNHTDAEAEKFLQIYNMVDSQNSEQRYLEAVLRARQGNQMRALALLNEAVGFGYNDIARMESEPDFQNLKNTGEFSDLVNKIKSKSK